MEIRNSLIALADFSLRAAVTESDRLAVYDAVATIAKALNRGDCKVLLDMAQDAASAIRHADEMQLKFKEVVTGGNGDGVGDGKDGQ